MIPRTFPSTRASNGEFQMVVFFLGDVTGLQRWVDYIPVRWATEAPGKENNYDQNGYINVVSIGQLGSNTTPFKDYVPVFIDNSASDAWTTNIAGYIPVGQSTFGGVTLGLDFTTTQTLDPRITFTRASNATVTNSAGVIAYAPHNLLTFSEQFDNAAWTKTRSSISANTAVAPDGTTTADKLVEDTSANATHLAFQTFSAAASTAYVFSCYVKAAERSAFTMVNTKSGMSTVTSNFNLVNGTVISTTSADSKIEALSNGWYRVSQTLTTDAVAGTLNLLLYTNNGTTTVYTGDGTSGIFIWGAQLNVGALQPYYPTTVKNLLGFTQEFDNAAWSKVEATIAANSTAAPDGSMTADTFVESTATTAHFTTQSATVISGTVYTLSTYAKNNGRAVQLAFGTGNFGSNAFANFDLSSGVVGSVGSAATATIQSVGNGWYRCAIAAPATTSGSAALVIYGATTPSASRAPSYTGNGTSGIFIWGAQLSDSASLDQYVYNPGASPAAAAYYGPRFDYDPVTLAPKGLLIEEQRTNLLLQSEAFDNASWVKSGTTVTANSAVSPDGIQDADTLVLSAGTSTKYVEQSVTTAATAYALSFFAKANGHQFIQVRSGAAISAGFVNFDVVNGVVGTQSTWTGTITSVGNGWFRVVVLTGTVSAATAAMVIQGVGSNTAGRNDTVTASGTTGVFLWGAQLEAGAFATSYIPTTTSAATRAADVAVMTGANFSNWYNQSEGTLFAEAVVPPNLSAFPTVATISDGSVNNQTSHYAFTSGTYANVRSGGVVQGDPGRLFTPTTGINYKFAVALGSNQGRAAANGVIGTLITPLTMPVNVNQMRIGANATGGAVSNTHIRRLAYYPRRLANAELQAITV